MISSCDSESALFFTGSQSRSVISQLLLCLKLGRRLICVNCSNDMTVIESRLTFILSDIHRASVFKAGPLIINNQPMNHCVRRVYEINQQRLIHVIYFAEATNV